MTFYLSFSSLDAKPFVAGFENSQLSQEAKGRLLIQELACVSCHASNPNHFDFKKAPDLRDVGERINPYYLEQYLTSPHLVKPGANMPDMLAHLDQDEKKNTAKALTHFLLGTGKNNFQLDTPDRVAAKHGKKVFHKVGCVTCHSPRDESLNETMPSTSVPLGDLSQKYRVKSLMKFLANPHAVRPSGRMPKIPFKGRELEHLSHYLLSQTQIPGHVDYTVYQGKVWEGLEGEVTQVKAGQTNMISHDHLGLRNNMAVKYKTLLTVPAAGEYTFHVVMNGGALTVNGKNVLKAEGNHHRGVETHAIKVPLQKTNNVIEFIYLNMGRNPSLKFELEGEPYPRKTIASKMMRIRKESVPAYKPYQLDKKLIEVGRKKFQNLGCANCHTGKTQATPINKPFASLKLDQGCLGPKKQAKAHYALSGEQKEAIRAAIPKLKRKLDQTENMKLKLASLNCIACHKRDGVGGVHSDRHPFFKGTHHELGPQGAFPPPLDGVGAKITKSWMEAVMYHGRRQREYLETRMPQYGQHNLKGLVEAFKKLDKVEPIQYEKYSDLKKMKEAGHLLVGTKKLMCIACHDFNGRKSALGGLELVTIVDRLEKDWYMYYMQNPAKFRPGIIMPSYWPGGVSLHKDVLGGSSNKQINAIWLYLKDGKRAKAPEGLSRQSPELLVADKAVMGRGRGTKAGYRAIGVGYPSQIHLVFDSEEMALRHLWKGEFARTNHSQFFINGSHRIEFEAGIPFYRLKKKDEFWPYKREKDYTFPYHLGYQFRGYFLDDLMRPTFRYTYGDIKVEDFFEDKLDKKNAYFVRHMKFETSKDQAPFQFRVASGKQVEKISKNEYRVDRLRLRFSETAEIREGLKKELIIPLNLKKGQTKLTIEYRW